MQLALPEDEYWPDEHDKHFSFVSDDPYVPDEHVEQLEDPADEYFPVPQFVQVDDVPPAEYVPAPHLTHDPLDNLYPPLHVKHFPVVVEHVLHNELHVVQTIVPPVEYFPDEHTVQV